MSLLAKTKEILNTYRIHPRKRLGQNFLVEEEALRKMTSYAMVSEEDTVLEIGAGLGFLTERLAQKAKAVIAVEIDANLAEILRNRLRNYENATILEGDIMKIPIPSFNKVVSTPPYSISSPLLFWLLDKEFEDAILAFQEEFARRLVASVGSDDYGRLTVSVHYRSEVELLEAIPRWMFWPKPAVDSFIVHIRPRKPPFSVENEEIFFEVLRILFTQKNKKLRNAVLPFLEGLRIPKGEAVEIADSLQFHERRTRELMPEEIGLTANEIVNRIRKTD